MKQNRFLFFAVAALYVAAGVLACGLLFLKGSSMSLNGRVKAKDMALYDIKPNLAPSKESKEAIAEETKSEEAEDGSQSAQAVSEDENQQQSHRYLSFTVVPIRTFLHVRKTDSMEAEILYHLYSGETGIVLESSSPCWSHIKTSQGEGYAFNEYLDLQEIPREEYEALEHSMSGR